MNVVYGVVILLALAAVVIVGVMIVAAILGAMGDE